MHPIKYGLTRGGNALLDLLFPQSCLGCSVHGHILCDECISSIRQVERETGEEIMALYDYRDNVIRRSIWNLKYYRKRCLGKILGKLLYGSFLEEIADIAVFSGSSPIIVMPVPMSKNRKRNRGYNQAEIIARHFCTASPDEIFKFERKIIYKNKDTARQATITNRSERLKNIKDAFGIKNKDRIKGRTIIVIDDVTTTGATLNEIIKLLKKSGAKRVVGIALAH